MATRTSETDDKYTIPTGAPGFMCLVFMGLTREYPDGIPDAKILYKGAIMDSGEIHFLSPDIRFATLRIRKAEHVPYERIISISTEVATGRDFERRWVLPYHSRPRICKGR